MSKHHLKNALLNASQDTNENKTLNIHELQHLKDLHINTDSKYVINTDCVTHDQFLNECPSRSDLAVVQHEIQHSESLIFKCPFI